MAEVSPEMLQSLMQRVLDGQGSIREEIGEIRKETGRMSGRISLIEPRLSTVLSTVRTGMETMADLQNQIDTLAERVERLEEARSDLGDVQNGGLCSAAFVQNPGLCGAEKVQNRGYSRIGFVQNPGFGGGVLYQTRVRCGSGSWPFGWRGGHNHCGDGVVGERSAMGSWTAVGHGFVASLGGGVSPSGGIG